MVNLTSLLATFPNGAWENIIRFFNNGLGNYALAIIVITLCIKLLMLPIDYLNRRSSVKMTEVQQKIAPKMAEIQKKYPDKMVQNQKMQELYQKEGFNPSGSCVTMLIVMGVTMFVFFSLFSGLNSMAAYKITDQYEKLQAAYVQEYVMEKEGLTTEEEFNELGLTYEQVGDYVIEISTNGTAEQTQAASAAVKKRYEEVRESFLWIKNVWIADSPFQKAIPSFESYSSTAKLKLEDAEYDKAKQVYNVVMSDLMETEGVNGYFILAILAGASAFLYQWLLTKSKKKKQNFYDQNNNQANQTQQTNKAMLIILPVIMTIFTLSYNAIFALYIIVGQLFGMATAPLINKLLSLQKKDKK